MKKNRWEAWFTLRECLEHPINDVSDTNPQKQGGKKDLIFIQTATHIKRDIFFASQTELKTTVYNYSSIQKGQQYIFARNFWGLHVCLNEK